MATDYQLLLQKFNNFKIFVTEHSKNRIAIEEYKSLTENQFLLNGVYFLLPNKHQLEKVGALMCQKLKIEGQEDMDKVTRYLQCFVEYLDQLNSPEFTKDVLKANISEQGIKIPSENIPIV